MNLLKEIHRFALPIPGFGHHLVLLALLLCLVSLFMLFRPGVPRAFMWLLRLNWLAYAVNALSGIALAILGQRVPSATPGRLVDGQQLSVVGFPLDVARSFDHLMYAFFCILTLYGLELLAAGRLLKDGWLRRLLFVVATVFLFGCAFMAVRVSFYPGNTPHG